jgi:hypothetical protein
MFLVGIDCLMIEAVRVCGLVAAGWAETQVQAQCV